MDIFALPAAVEAEMFEHVADSPDREVGGFLVGPTGGPVERAVRIANIAENQRTSCEFDPVAVDVLFDLLDETGMTHHATYHSHVTGPALPSPADLAAEDIAVAHLIIAPQAKPMVRAWRITEDDDGKREAVEVAIHRVGLKDVDTHRTQLSVGNTVDLTYRTSCDDQMRRFPRTRVVRAGVETVVVLHDRRQVTIGLDRVVSVAVLEEATDAAARRQFAARQLAAASAEMSQARIGSSRAAIEAAFRAIPGLRPRMNGEP